jgi:hypothetical protein
LGQLAISKIVSGGQTGVDRGALDAALAVGFACDGWVPGDRIVIDARQMSELEAVAAVTAFVETNGIGDFECDGPPR